MADDDSLWERHKNRKEVNWTPYAERHRKPASGACRYVDDGGVVTVYVPVQGMGEMVFKLTAKFDPTTEYIKWDQSAEMTMRLTDEHSECLGD